MGGWGVNFEDWKCGVPERVKAEPEWRFYAYPRALFLYELVWNDCERLVQDRRGRAVAEQIIRSGGSVSANIEEGYGRGIGTKSYLYFLRVAIGSARETKGWYFRSRHLLSAEALDHRLALADEIIALLATEISRHQKRYS
jgi:four helix bundle protein